MANDFQDFLSHLEAVGELQRIAVEVDPHLEMGAIADRVSKQPGGGKALLFEKPKGHSMPVVMNAYGSCKRMAMALGVEKEERGLDSIADRIEKLIQEAMPKPGLGFFDKLAKLPMLAEVGNWMPKTVRKGVCQEIVLQGAEVKLSRLPVLTTWPEDGGPFITLGLSHTRNKATGHRNVGLYRLQVFDERTLGFHTQLHHDGARNRHGYDDTEKMPVAVSFGGDPNLTYCATAPLPPFLSELMFAGFLRGSGIELVKCITNDLEVPADSEVVIEGYVNPRELRNEGPFGDHTGYYSLAREYPVFHLKAVTRRKQPIYPTTIVGRPPQEDFWLGKATERIFLPIIRLMLPEVVDMNMPAEGVFHNLVIVSIKKRYPGQARKVMYALWGLGLMMLAKNILVVSDHVDVQNLSEVAWRATGNVDAKRDIVIVDGPMDDLDHAALRHRFGGKMGIDATEKTADDGIVQPWPEEIAMSEEIRVLVTKRWQEYGL